MQLGFLTANIDDIAKAAQLGFDAIELNVRGIGNPLEQDLDAAAIERVKQLCKQQNIILSALAYYDLAGRQPSDTDVLRAYGRIFDAMEALGVQTVASMSGFDANRDWKGNIQLFADRFGPVAERAEQQGKRVAF